MSIILGKDYAYVAGALVTTTWLQMYQSVTVSRHRKRAGIKYPQMYAEQSEVNTSNDAHLFNCAQRAHQNTLEYLPTALVTTLVTALSYPIPAAAGLTLWSIGRVFYTRGYITGDPKKRNSGFAKVNTLAGLGLLLSSAWVAVDLIRAALK